MPPHLQDPAAKDRPWKWEELTVDCGMSVEEIRREVQVGDVISFDRQCVELANNKLAGKSMDDRAGIAVMFEMARELARLKHSADVFMVATVQEEVSYGGGITATFGVMPDIGIAVDVGHASMPACLSIRC